MNTHSSESAGNKSENHSQKNHDSHQTGFKKPNEIKNKIKNNLSPLTDEIKNKSSMAKNKIASYVKANPFKAMGWAAVTSFLISKFL